MIDANTIPEPGDIIWGNGCGIAPQFTYFKVLNVETINNGLLMEITKVGKNCPDTYTWYFPNSLWSISKKKHGTPCQHCK